MLLLIYFLIAVGVSFLCSILEAVLLSITPSYIKVLKKENPKAGKLLAKQKADMDRSIGAILTLNTFAHTLGAAGVGAEAVKLFGEEYMFFISATLTILILFLSEIVPKTIGAYYWKELSIISSKFIQVFVFITSPLLIIMQKVTNLITSKKDGSSTITKDEILATASIGKDAGVIKHKENNIIENKSKIIKPIFKINKNIPISKLLDMFLSKKQQMFLVLDNYNQTEGIVTLEDTLETLLGTEIVDELDITVDMRELAKV
ncbi:MAG: CNNM domain-containing protein [Campylobacterota bacterium]|nr:CNNM domain-containing protein [Campylobacterota bacterium]